MQRIQNNSVRRKSFRDTQEATFRRLQRDKVRKSHLTRAERDVLLAFLNHWFHHRHDGPVHPGRKKLAKRARVSLRMVNYTLAMLREFGVIEAVSFETGNCAEGMGMATEYTLDVWNLTILCAEDKDVLIDWRREFKMRYNGVQICRGVGGAKRAARNNYGTVIPFRVQGGDK